MFAACGVWTASSGQAMAQTVTASQYRFAFALPPGWTEIPVSSKDLGALLSALTKADPAIKNALSQEAVDAAKEGLKVFAVGPIAGDFVPNLNILVRSASGLPSGSTFVNLMSSEVEILLASEGATQVKTAAAQLPLGQAVRATYLLRLLTGGTVAVRGLQLYFEHLGRLYVVTFSALSMTEDQSAARVVQASWRWRAVAG